MSGRRRKYCAREKAHAGLVVEAFISFYHGVTETRRSWKELGRRKIGQRPTANDQRRLSIHGVVLRNHSFAAFVLQRHSEQVLIRRFARSVAAVAAVMKNDQRRSGFPID